MAGKRKLASPVAKVDNVVELGKEVTQLTKDYTKQVKSAGKKYGKMLDVKVLIELVEPNT